MFYEEVFKKLNQHHVDYVVVGGVALVLHGALRFTADLDLMVNLERANLKKLITVIKELGYKPKIPVKAESFLDPATRTQWLKEKNMEVFSFYHPKQHINFIDVFIHEPICYEEIRKTAVKVNVGHLKVPLVSQQNLIALKTISGRPQDLADIAALKMVMQNEKK